MLCWFGSFVSAASAPQPGGMSQQTPEKLIEDGGTRDLRGRTVRGGALILGLQVLQQIARLVLLATLARMLSPRDYGLLGMVMVFTAFLNIFRDLGLSVATVQRAEINEQQVSTLFWLNVALGAALAALLAGCALPIAHFYGEPRLARVTLWLSLGFIISAAGTQSTALLTRRMHFGYVGLNELIALVVGGAIGIGMAIEGYGVFALVGQALGQAVAATTGSFAFARWRPGLPRRTAGIGQMVRFGGYLTAFNVINYIAFNIEKPLLGRFWDATVVGLYTRSFTLMNYPVILALWPITRVMLPVLSKLQKDKERFAAVLVRVLRLLSLIGFPIAGGLVVMADEAVLVAYGDTWENAVPIFRILCLAGIPQSWAMFSGSIFTSTGKTRELFRIGCVTTSIYVVAMVPCVWFGAVGAAVGFTIAEYVTTPLVFWYASRVVGIPLRRLTSAAVGPLLATALMCAVIAALKWGVVGDWALVPRVAVIVATGGVVFGLATLIFARDSVREALAMLRELRR